MQNVASVKILCSLTFPALDEFLHSLILDFELTKHIKSSSINTINDTNVKTLKEVVGLM